MLTSNRKEDLLISISMSKNIWAVTDLQSSSKRRY